MVKRDFLKKQSDLAALEDNGAELNSTKRKVGLVADAVKAYKSMYYDDEMVEMLYRYVRGLLMAQR